MTLGDRVVRCCLRIVNLVNRIFASCSNYLRLRTNTVPTKIGKFANVTSDSILSGEITSAELLKSSSASHDSIMKSDAYDVLIKQSGVDNPLISEIKTSDVDPYYCRYRFLRELDNFTIKDLDQYALEFLDLADPISILDDGVVRDIFRCAITYYNNKDSVAFTYSGKGTLFDNDFDPGNPLIDCSSMMQAWITGVPYENSKYVSSENTPSFLYAITLPDNPYSPDRPGRYYANELAHYFYDNGYAFVPKEDYSDIRPGDIIFMSFDTKAGNAFHENAFLKIDHCSLVVGFKDSTHLTCLHTTSDQIVSMYDIRTESSIHDPNSDNQYNDSIVLVARPPFNATEPVRSEPIVKYDNEFISTSTTNGLLATINIPADTIVGNMSYTAVVYVDNAYEHGDAIINNNYVGLRGTYDGSDHTIASWMYNIPPDNNVYYIHFVTNELDHGIYQPETLKVYVLNTTVSGHVFKGFRLYEGLVRPDPDFNNTASES